MKIKDSLFFALLVGFLFLILILHMSLKNLLKETVFGNLSRIIMTPDHNHHNKHHHQEKVIPLADSKQDLMNYVKSSIKQIHENQDIRVKASNFFSPFHQSDMHNEETDLSKYFQIDQGVPETTNMMKDLQCNNMYGGSATCKEPVKPRIDTQSGNPMYFDQGSNGDLTYKPDIWTYDNERPMNGGGFDGIRGQDTLQNDFAIYEPNSGFSQPGFKGGAYPGVQSSGTW